MTKRSHMPRAYRFFRVLNSVYKGKQMTGVSLDA
jgi:hypothetical protein